MATPRRCGIGSRLVQPQVGLGVSVVADVSSGGRNLVPALPNVSSSKHAFELHGCGVLVCVDEVR
jgi:hypothetical protein